MAMWTEEQWAAIEPKDVSSVVVAAPGSGKTTVMTEHMAQVIATGRTPAQRILAMTFTRQAAEHMRQKLRRHERLRPVAVESCVMGTFHAVFFRALLEADWEVRPVLSQRDQYALMREAVVDVLGERRAVTMYELQSYLTMYSWTVGRQAWDELGDKEKRIFETFVRKKQASNYWDHDDILLASLQLLRSKTVPKIRLCEMSYILVDEFQDTNELQWELLTSLVQRNGAFAFVVGDDDQSIYAFRGASPVYLQRAVEVLPKARQKLLTMNFRSDRRILHHAAQLIQHVKSRVDKPLRGVHDAEGICRAYEVQHRTAQWDVLARVVRRSVLRPYSVAILARTRNQLATAWTAMRSLLGAEWSLAARNVEFRTFHDSKGKEWDVVALLDMAVPYRAMTDSDDERRLLYVAMTRARHELYAFVPRVIQGTQCHIHPYLLEAGLRACPVSPKDIMEAFEIG
ncbi:UvrD-helicase domain-containing protein [Alicyclobacillus mali (ex Roth et al. 2021)]|nr:UvrD-helicase domain-containing protein [Alicyclobacillus mali (ex Roth et al. 2021)]